MSLDFFCRSHLCALGIWRNDFREHSSNRLDSCWLRWFFGLLNYSLVAETALSKASGIFDRRFGLPRGMDGLQRQIDLRLGFFRIRTAAQLRAAFERLRD